MGCYYTSADTHLHPNHVALYETVVVLHVVQVDRSALCNLYDCHPIRVQNTLANLISPLHRAALIYRITCSLKEELQLRIHEVFLPVFDDELSSTGCRVGVDDAVSGALAIMHNVEKTSGAQALRKYIVLWRDSSLETEVVALGMPSQNVVNILRKEDVYLNIISRDNLSYYDLVLFDLVVNPAQQDDPISVWNSSMKNAANQTQVPLPSLLSGLHRRGTSPNHPVENLFQYKVEVAKEPARYQDFFELYYTNTAPPLLPARNIDPKLQAAQIQGLPIAAGPSSLPTSAVYESQNGSDFPLESYFNLNVMPQPDPMARTEEYTTGFSSVAGSSSQPYPSPSIQTDYPPALSMPYEYASYLESAPPASSRPFEEIFSSVPGPSSQLDPGPIPTGYSSPMRNGRPPHLDSAPHAGALHASSQPFEEDLFSDIPGARIAEADAVDGYDAIFDPFLSSNGSPLLANYPILPEPPVRQKRVRIPESSLSGWAGTAEQEPQRKIRRVMGWEQGRHVGTEAGPSTLHTIEESSHSLAVSQSGAIDPVLQEAEPTPPAVFYQPHPPRPIRGLPRRSPNGAGQPPAAMSVIIEPSPSATSDGSRVLSLNAHINNTQPTAVVDVVPPVRRSTRLKNPALVLDIPPADDAAAPPRKTRGSRKVPSKGKGKGRARDDDAFAG